MGAKFGAYVEGVDRGHEAAVADIGSAVPDDSGDLDDAIVEALGDLLQDGRLQVGEGRRRSRPDRRVGGTPIARERGRGDRGG